MLIRIREFRNRQRGREVMGQIAGIVFSLLIVAGVTVLIGGVMYFYKIDDVIMLYLIPVLVAALRSGIIPALVAAIAGVAATDFFFYPPINSFRIRDPGQIIDLVLFIIIAIVTGQLAALARRAKMRAQSEGLRDALIGSVSHELRTPLAGILGSASILQQSPTIEEDEQLSSLVRVVHKESKRLNGYIQNLLDATRISSDGIQPRWEWNDPEDIINAALTRKQRLLGERQIKLVVANDLPMIYADPMLIESALGQLIENATIYSAPGTPISISAVHVGSTFQIKVTDEGEGLVLGEGEKIFERFYRSPRQIGTIPGSGLGLWIARALIGACGGTIRALSPGPGCGTTLRIDLPIKAQPASDED